MMGMDALFNSPAAVKLAAAAMGLTAARLDYHAPTKTLYLSIARHGQIEHIRLPSGRTFSRDEICDLLAGSAQTDRDAPGPASQLCGAAHAPGP